MLKHNKNIIIALICLLASLSFLDSFAAETEGNWQQIIRSTPYSDSQGVAENLKTIRRWVLFNESYCGSPNRHLLLDSRWRFVAYMNDADSAEATNELLNLRRQSLVEEERATLWYPGALNTIGYPFALACDQPFADMNEAIARLTGSNPDYQLWGTWDGIAAGTEDNQVSLIELFNIVIEHRQAQGRFTFPDSVLPTFLGKIIIESGGQKNALSSEAARGIMQLSPEVLDDCEIPERFRLHRIAQVDCALKLVEQNHRNLQPVFKETFGNLPENKREKLYGLLLTQAYLIGVGRSIELLNDKELGQAAKYFSDYHQSFSAEDILLGMIYHNLGKRDIGLRSLYYVTDARLAQSELESVIGQ